MPTLSVFIIPVLSAACLLIVLTSSKLHGRAAVFTRTDKKRTGFILKYGRKIVIACSFVWSFVLYMYAAYTIPVASYALSELMRLYALTALFLMYIVLAPGLVSVYFPRYPWNGIFIYLRRSFGLSVFYFAFLHALIAFFSTLSGNVGALVFLPLRSQTALVMSACTFVILFLLAITSTDAAEKKLGKRWKQLHRYVYPASVLAIFHAFFIGSHFVNPRGVIPVSVNFLSLTYIFLEAAATVKRRLQAEPDWTNPRNIRLWLLLVSVAVFGVWASVTGLQSTYDPHAAHRKGYSTYYVMNVTTTPKNILPGMPVRIVFSITDTRTGRKLTKYQRVMEKLLHVVVIRKDLRYYDHIHPEYASDGTFSIVHTFPTSGTYTLFAEYSPPDFYENMSRSVISVGSSDDGPAARIRDTSTTKTFESVRVNLAYTRPLRVNDTVDFTFTLTDAATGTPLRDLEPYLSSFGHMSSVSRDLSVYTHVHPLAVPLTPNDSGGPSVQFSTFFPKAGQYTLFTQFKRNGSVFVTDFTVDVP